MTDRQQVTPYVHAAGVYPQYCVINGVPCCDYVLKKDERPFEDLLDAYYTITCIIHTKQEKRLSSAILKCILPNAKITYVDGRTHAELMGE